MRAAGFRPVQFWVPDRRGADCAERVRQQCLKLKGDPAELDALRFVEEAAAQVEGWPGSEAILSRFRCKVTKMGVCSCRDRVRRYVEVSSVAGSLEKE